MTRERGEHFPRGDGKARDKEYKEDDEWNESGVDMPEGEEQGREDIEMSLGMDGCDDDDDGGGGGGGGGGITFFCWLPLARFSRLLRNLLIPLIF